MAARARSIRSPMPRWCGKATRSAGSGLGASCRRCTAAAERLGRRRRAGHPGAGGLPHPPGVRRLAGGGVRASGSRGRSYLEIARAGGGIARTVRLTRAASEDELLERADGFLQAMLRLGRDDGGVQERLRARPGARAPAAPGVSRAWRSGSRSGWCPTFLGAHVVPPEFRDDRAGYLALLEAMLPELAREGLARFCDVFVEQSAFSAGRGAAAAPRRRSGTGSAPSCTPTS